MRTLYQDLRYGLRVLRADPAFAATAILTLAVAIAANSAVFSWIDAVWLRPFPGASDANRVMALETIQPGEGNGTSYRDYQDYRDKLRLISGLAATRQPNLLQLGDGAHAQRVWGEMVSGNYFDVLGVKAHRGRLFLPEEFGDKPGAYPVAVISHRLWRNHFQSIPETLGSTVRVNRYELTIVGVAQPDFQGTTRGLAYDIWVPIMMGRELGVIDEYALQHRGDRSMFGLARLKPGVSMEQARAEVSALAGELATRYPDTNHRVDATLLPESESHSGIQSLMIGHLRILMVVCFVVLFIACVNVSGLLLARAVSRQREVSLRMALGAGAGRIARQLMTETLLLAGLGAAIGIPLAELLGQSLWYLLPPTGLPVALDVEVNAAVLGFTTLICVTATLASGMAPALLVRRSDVNSALKEGGRSATAGVSRQRIRGVFVVAEVALALIVLVGAGLFLQSFQATSAIDPGFDPTNVLVSRLDIPARGYSPEERQQSLSDLQRRMQADSLVIAASYADTIPLGFGSGPGIGIQVEGYTPAPGEDMSVSRTLAAPGYFDLMRIPVMEGRDFTDQDDHDAPPVIVVNEAFTRKYFDGGYAVGRKVRGWNRTFTVIAMVRDSKYYYPTEAPRPYCFIPVRQAGIPAGGVGMAVYIRTAGEPETVVSTLRREARAAAPGAGPLTVMPLDEYIGGPLFPQRVTASLLTALGFIALLLAAVGLYSVIAFAVSQRTHEIGIRVALGATSRSVKLLVVRHGMMLTLAGLLIGLAVTLAGAHLVAGMLFEVNATDPVTIVAATLFLGAIAFLASYLPARRVARINPIDALRDQ